MFVLKTIEKMETKIDQLEDTVNNNNSEFKSSLVALQTKAGFAGGLFGVVSSIVVSVVGGLILYYMTANKENDKNQTPNVQYQQPYQYQQPQYQQPYQQPQPQYQQPYQPEIRQPITPQNK
jgi:hypothetical protein